MTFACSLNRIARLVFFRSTPRSAPRIAVGKIAWLWVEDGVDWALAVELALQQSPSMRLTTLCRTCGVKCVHEIHELGIKNFRAAHLVSALDCGHRCISCVRTRFHLPAIQIPQTDQQPTLRFISPRRGTRAGILQRR